MNKKSALELTSEVVSETIKKMVDDFPKFMEDLKKDVESDPKKREITQTLTLNMIRQMKRDARMMQSEAEMRNARSYYDYMKNDILKDVKVEFDEI